jgi:DNA-binding winged helix-turn-helix (wHTH) protein
LEQIVINGYQVNWPRAELVKGDTIKPIEAKHLAMLKLLAQANGNIVSQQQMLDVVWESTIVSPNTIQHAITQLRKLLDDDGRSQKAIKTHPKLGYSLIFKTSHSPIKTKTTNQKLPTIFLMVMALLVLLMTLFMFNHQTTQK